MIHQLTVCLIALITAACAAPQGSKDNDAELIFLRNRFDKVGGHEFRYELSNGQKHEEASDFKDIINAEGQTTKVLVVSGAYSFVGPDGQTYSVDFTADENGFHPIIGTEIKTGPSGPVGPGGDYGVNPNALKSLIG